VDFVEDIELPKGAGSILGHVAADAVSRSSFNPAFVVLQPLFNFRAEIIGKLSSFVLCQTLVDIFVG
jgi:hypothetical protein